jgi:3-isopropylmalate/(R)-2-methylmalate dehydratase small subunit
VIAPGFADIFYNNSFKTGFLPIVLKPEEVEALFQGARAEGYRLTVDLPAQTVSAAGGPTFGFDIDPFRKDCLVRGLDEIGLTLQQADNIRAYEARRRTEAPWLFA